MSGLLGSIYSYGNTLQRKLKGLLADPAGTIGLGVTRMGEDQQQLVNLAQDAGYMPGSRSVLATPQQKALARALLAQKATDMGAGMMQAATVWHGSPHKFDRFDSSKIGTGEGAQAYGHGLYLAEAPDVARSYAESLAALQGKSPAQQITTLLGIDEYAKGGGNLYKVDLPDSMIARMLDWDKPLSQQAPDIVEMLRARGMSQEMFGKDIWETLVKGQKVTPLQPRPSGTGFVQYNREAPARATAALRDAGIPGIRYLDGGSRGAGAGTSNYVVFPGEEGALTILERNGEQIKALAEALRGR